jgi:hypothetical protein
MRNKVFPDPPVAAFNNILAKKYAYFWHIQKIGLDLLITIKAGDGAHPNITNYVYI